RTDEKGLATFELGYGKYYYQEFDAPEGYVIDEKLYPFEIKTSGEIVKASMTNKKLEETDKPNNNNTSNNALPNTGGTDTYLYMMLALLITFTGFRLFRFRHEK
ncbi:SpaA isopeptide-forming pilin-related protein, partial [Clostridium nigeriense]|uniref:prealbumin-like fold domain-containing protein n=1 Tax=Clostridium nigeriense TaxID=1805470 RepID=UPI003D352D40